MNKKITISDLEDSFDEVLGTGKKFISKNPIKSFGSILPIISTLFAGVFFEGKRRGKGKAPKADIWSA